MADDGNRLTSSDKRALILWVLLGVVGLAFAYRYFFRAFPEASVDFKISRGEALARAQKFVGTLGEDAAGYQSAIVFDVDDNAKTYLEREVGLQQANRMMSGELNIWYWDVRFFRPQQEEEFYVRVSPAGEIVGYEHKIEEARAGATLDRAAAETTAREFLRKMGVDLSKWEFLSEEANSSQKPNRVDWSFTWEKRGFRAKDAPDRLSVTLEGDRAGSSREFLQVPEAWERDYAKLRSKNLLYNQVAIIPYLLLMGAALWLGILLTIRGQTSWGLAIKLGIVVAILLTLMQLNNWPLDRMSYDTNSAYGGFVFKQIAFALLFGVGSALLLSLVIPGAEPLYRASQPERLRLSQVLTLRGLRSKEFFSSATVGLSLAAAHIGFIVAFYIVAGYFGAWAPQELNYENSVNTTFPWISGVAIGLYAATSEEFLFRLFAVPFLKRLTGSSIIAVIVPAFCWSFLHSAYPNEPPYIRGLEVGLIGIVAGIVMLRWGILATLIWHYTVDASLVGLLLVRSNSLYFKISGVVVGLAAVAPLIFAGVSYLARGRFEADEDLLNSAQPIPEVSFEAAPTAIDAAAPATRRYDALTPAMMTFLAVCLVLGGVAAWSLKAPALGDYVKVSANARTVKARANEVMRQRGFDPKSYRTATIFTDFTDPMTNEFLRQLVGIARLNEIYATELPGAIWQVRYFRDSQAEEFSVKLKPDGSLAAFNHKLAEDAPGASLSKEEALAKAEEYLNNIKKIDLSQWNLVEADSDKRVHRTDHEIAWQRRTPLDAGSTYVNDPANHAYLRMKLAVLGDEVSEYRGSYYSKPEAREEQEAREGGTGWMYIKIPDEWRRKQEEQPLSRTIYGFGVPTLLFGGIGITAIVFFFKNLRSEAMRAVPWRRLVLWATGGLAGYVLIVAFGNRIQSFLNSYQTAIPFKAMLGGVAIGILVGAFLYLGGLAVLFGFAAYFSNRVFGEERLPVGRPMPGVYYRDALWIGVCGTAGFLGVRRLVESIAVHWPTAHRGLPFSLGQNFDAVLPAGAFVGGALIGGLFVAGLIAFIAALMASVIQARLLRFLFFVLGALFLTGSDWGNGPDFAKQFLGAAILLGVTVFGVRLVMRFNMLGGVLVVACLSLLGAAAQLLAQPDAFYRTNGYALILAIGVLLALPLSAWRLRAATGG